VFPGLFGCSAERLGSCLLGGASALPSPFGGEVLKGFCIVVCVLLFLSVGVAQSKEWGDFSFMKQQKGSLFGWDYAGRYSQWFGLKGYGFGLELGYVGVVYGWKETIKLTLPEWLGVDASGNAKKKELDMFVDGFTYLNLGQMALFPDRVRGWLFWELSIWFGLR